MKRDKHPQAETRVMKTYFIKDTFEVYFNPHSRCDAPYFMGLTTEGRISRETTIERIRGGLHNQVIAVSEIDEGMTISVDTALIYADDMSLRFGTRAKNGTATVKDIEVQPDGSFITKDVEVEGSILDMSAGAFAQNGELQLHTLAYDAEKGDKIVADIYYIFPNVKPSSSFEQIYSMGDNNIQTLEFTPQVMRDQKSYGQYIVVPRELEDEDEDCGFDEETQTDFLG